MTRYGGARWRMRGKKGQTLQAVRALTQRPIQQSKGSFGKGNEYSGQASKDQR